MPDGSVVLVELARGTLSRVTPDARIEVIAELGGGPNGAAIGPDGYCYVCNCGGLEWEEVDGVLYGGDQPDDYSGGRIERVDLETGNFEVLYDSCDGNPLKGPNDIVFDRAGGFWFTDYGQSRKRDRDLGGAYYARTDGSFIKEVIYPLETADGIGLSPDEKTLYVAETITQRLLAFEVIGPGEVEVNDRYPLGRLVANLPGLKQPDSLAVDSGGIISMGTLIDGGVTSVAPDGTQMTHIATGDPLTTNICFGGESLKTAYVTLSGTGRLVALDWPRPGMPLPYLNHQIPPP